MHTGMLYLLLKKGTLNKDIMIDSIEAPMSTKHATVCEIVLNAHKMISATNSNFSLLTQHTYASCYCHVSQVSACESEKSIEK